ncbi:MAG: SusC/RagA family TonB-linked outer membrane protein [Bacteroidetes bacterium]|nr:MAG: SusC/RagA family TonB-linked outer membrane protein [Bacteroidota bacterium]
MKKSYLIYFVFLSMLVHLASAQEHRVTGTVTDAADGSTLPGVTVLVRGTGAGTITDNAGRYEIAVPEDGVLVFSFIGMMSQTVNVGGRSVVNVALSADVATLQEIVVTALGISRERKALSYSVQGVGGDELSEAKDINLVNSLSGRIAGVQVTSGGGGIGASSRITIRGNSSFGNNQPLFVVDGTPISNFATAVSQYGGADYGNAIMDIDAANIESVTVLKGGMAAALYGQNAANGVILITTKDGSGKRKNFGVNISSAVTFETPYIFPAYQNKYGQGLNGEMFLYNKYLADNNLTEAEYSYQDYAYERTFRYYNGRGGGLFDGRDESWGAKLDIGLMLPQFNSPYTLDENGLPVYQNTPWISQPNNTRDFFETGLTMDNFFEIYGSSDNSVARLGVSSMQSQGTIPNTDLTRYSVNFSGELKISERFSGKATVNYVKNFSDNLPGGGYESDNVMQSIGGWFGRQVDMEALKENWQTKDPFGYWYNWNQTYFSNPYFIVNRMLKSRDRNRVFGNFSLNYKLAEGLALTGRIGNDYFGENRKEVWPDGSIGIDVTQGGRFNINERVNNEFNADLFLNFDQPINDDFRVDGLLGGNYYQRSYRFQGMAAAELTVPDLFTIGNVSGNPTTSMFNSKVVTNSVFGSLNVGFRNYLFLNATGRNDWSSTLPEGAWSYFYPSVGLGFVFTEAFGLENNILSFGKVRASWAEIGKATDPYNTRGTYAPAAATFKGVTQFFISRQLPPVGLKNENTTSYEVGLEMAFLMNRLNFDITYFNNLSRDQILGVNISPASGYSSMLINAGEIETKGIELLLNAGIARNPGGFNWDVTVNWAKIENMVNELYGDLEAYQIASSWGGLTIEARPGKPYGTIMALGFARDQQGRVIVHPTTGRVLKTPVPVEVGNTTPDWLGGIRNSFSYRNLSVSALLDMRMGGDLFSVTHWFGGYAGVAQFTVENGVREDGVIVGDNILSDWGAVLAAVDGDGNILRDEDGFPIGSGTVNNIPISAQTYFMDFWGNQEASIIDGSFIKLREISIGYSIPMSIVNRMGFITGADVSLVGRNLALLYKHKSNNINIDPETGFGTSNAGVGLEQYQIPSSRSIGFRVNLNF